MILRLRDPEGESEHLIRARIRFEEEYCKLRNWNLNKLTEEQIAEIRSLLIWQHGLVFSKSVWEA